MDTYRRVKQQIAELEKKAANLRRTEAAKVIADIKKKIDKFELQPEDLFDSNPMTKSAAVRGKPGTPAPRSLTKGKAAGASAAKYRDPVSGKTWTGHGKAPNWIKGQDRQAFLIGTPATDKAAPEKSVASGRKAAPAAKKKAPAKSGRKAATRKSAGAVKKAVKAAGAAPVEATNGAPSDNETPVS